MSRSKFIDVSATIQVLGSLLKAPTILDQEDKYWFIEEDFPDEFHRIIFGCIHQISKVNSSALSIESIVDFLSSRPHNSAIFKQNNGEDFLLQASATAQTNAFDYYYNRVKKMTLLRGYNNIGFDVSTLYDVDNIMDIKKKEQQENWLDNSSLEDIADIIEQKISSIRENYTEGDYGDTYQAGQGINDLIERFKESPEIGIPLYGPLINTVTRGARLKKFYLRSAPSGIGKALPNSTIIPTPDGYKRVGDIKEGDYLFGQDGLPTKVLKIHPQEEEKEIWQVEFKDGRVAECCKDHLWEYRYKSHREFKYRTESIEDIYNRTCNLKGGLKEGNSYRFQIKLNEPVHYSEKEYSIDPYVMGCLLGDGSFRYNSSNKALTFSSADEELPNNLAKIMNKVAIKYSDKNYNYYFKDNIYDNHNLWVEEILYAYPELWNVKSNKKHIPFDYLIGSINQRMSLLQGLLDTDGSIDNKGRISYTTISPRLRDGIIEICNSLGFIATYLIDNREDKYMTGECYKIHIQCQKELKPFLFRLQRKKKIGFDYLKNTEDKRCEFKDHLAIIDIRKTTKKTDMTCFTVDNESHLFLMNNYLVTHNTRSNVADACNFACDRIFDENFGWIRNGEKNPTLFIATEQEIDEIQTLMLAFLSNVNEEHILNGEYEEGEEERVREAGRILSESPLYVRELPDFSVKDIENTIKKEIREHEVTYVVHDYIHTSMKILEEITRRSGGIKLREDNVLFMLSTKLKDICNIYGIFMLSSTQLNADWKESKTPDQNLLRGAKSIADKIDYGSHLLPVTDEDLASLSGIVSSFPSYPNIKISVYKNRRGRYTSLYLWCQADLGTCRIKPMFATTWSYDLISIDDIRVQVEEKSAF